MKGKWRFFLPIHTAQAQAHCRRQFTLDVWYYLHAMSAIFISHSRENAATAKLLVERLRRQGYTSVFLDVDPLKGILPGEKWEETLYRRIRACQAMILLVSRDWLASDWCKTEMRQAKALRKAVFPVRLDDSDWSILGDIQFADMGGNKASDPVVYESLFAGLEKARVSKGAWDTKRAPYPGLMAFEEEDAGVFFGRESDIVDHVARMHGMHEAGTPRWLVMVGASGSGKSSLVRAGLVPALRADERHRFVVVGPFRRGKDPFESAALALVEAFRRLGCAREASKLRETLIAADSAEFEGLARDLRVAAENAQAAVVMVVDQFEELLATRIAPAGPRAASGDASTEHSCETDNGFLALLRKLADIEGAPFFVLGTLRADFLGAFQSNPALRGLCSVALIVKPLQLEELPRVIQEPAILASIAFEDGLVDEIVRDTVAQDALPLLAFTLRELYDQYGTGGLIERRHYRELGGLREAVAKKAEEVFGKLQLSPGGGDEAELRAAFLSLVQPTDDGQVARHRRRWNELPKTVQPMLEDFVKARLLVSSEGDGAEPTLEVAHEALFRSWKRLKDWIAQNREFLAWRKQLESAVDSWQQSGRPIRELLHRPEVYRAELWLQKEKRLLSPMEGKFVVASIAAERRRKWLVRLSVATALSALAAAAGVAIVKQRQANAEATRARNLAMLTVATKAMDPAVSVAILREAPFPAPIEWVAAAGPASWSPISTQVLKGHEAALISVAFSPDGKKVLTASRDRTARVWNADGTGQAIVLTDQYHGIWSVAFSPDGKKVLTGSIDGTVQVWNAGGTGQITVLKGHQGWVSSVAFSPDGKKVLTGSADNTARLWNVDGTGDAFVLKGHEGVVHRAVLSPDGKKVLTGSADNTARVWNIDGTGEAFGEFLVLKGHEAAVLSVAFSADGKKVLTGSDDHTARVWNVDGAGQTVILRGHAGAVVSAVFGPDGKKVLTGSSDSTARVWNADGTGQAVVLKGHAGAVVSAVFSPDGKKVLTGSADNTARVWNADGTGEVAVLKGHEAAVLSVAFSADGKKVITGSFDNTARLWNADDTGQVAVLRGHEKRVTSVAFSADGKKVLTGSADNTARLWNDDGTGQPVVLKGLNSWDWVTSVAFSPDGKKLLVGSWGMARVWNADGSGSPVLLLDHKFASTPPFRSVAFSPDGKKVLAGLIDDTARVWNADGAGQPVVLKGHQDWVLAVAFSPDGKKVLTGSRDKTARVWNADGDGQPVILKGHQGGVLTVAFSLDSKKVLTGSLDHTARVWNADGTGEPVTLKGHQGWVTSAAFSPDGKKVLTGSSAGFGWAGNEVLPGTQVGLNRRPELPPPPADSTARVWNADGTGQPVTLKGHRGWVTSVAFSPDGKKVLTGSSDNTARVWNADGTGQPVILKGHETRVASVVNFESRSESGVSSVAFSPDGKKVLTGSSDNTARVWTLDPLELRTLLWRYTQFCLSAEQRSVLLGETESQATIGYARCERTVLRCRDGFDVCQKVVADTFDRR